MMEKLNGLKGEYNNTYNMEWNFIRSKALRT
jgi:hypothetical protein